MRKTLMLSGLAIAAVVTIIVAILVYNDIPARGDLAQTVRTATSTATLTATPTLIMLTAVPVRAVDSAAVKQLCGYDDGGPTNYPGNTIKTTFVRVGDLIFSNVNLGFLSYPLIHTPDQLPVNPHLGSVGQGFVFTICNASSLQSHKIQPAMLAIKTLDTISEPVSVTDPCSSGCGGAIGGPHPFFNAQLPPTLTNGTSVALAGDPVTLKPKSTSDFWITMNQPGIDGIYTFTLTLQADTVAFPYKPVTPSIIFVVNPNQIVGLTATPQKK